MTAIVRMKLKSSRRIGISKAADRPLRFTIASNADRSPKELLISALKS